MLCEHLPQELLFPQGNMQPSLGSFCMLHASAQGFLVVGTEFDISANLKIYP